MRVRILLVAIGALLLASPVLGQSTFPGALPISCAPGQIAVRNSQPNVWVCGNSAGGGDVTASGTLASGSVVIGGGGTVVSTTTTGTGVVTAIGINGGSAGALAKLGSGTPATNDCVKFDASNNLVTAGAACGSGGGGAPTDATYITQTANGSLSNEQAMGSLGTGLVINTTTTGVQSIYAGATCTNQFVRVLSASGAATCASVANADLAGSIALSKLATQAATTVVMNNTGGAAAPTAVDMAGLALALGIIDIPSLAQGDTIYASATDTLSALAKPADGNYVYRSNGTSNNPAWSNSLPFSAPNLFNAAVCQNTTASIGANLPASNAPTATCITGSNTNFGVALYTATGQSLQGNIAILEATSTTVVTIKGMYYGATTSTGNVVWTFSYARVAAGSTLDPSWTDVDITDAAGTANQLNLFSGTATISSLAAGDLLFWKVSYKTAPTTPGNQGLINVAVMPLIAKPIGG